MVGDQINTDITMALNFGIDSCLIEDSDIKFDENIIKYSQEHNLYICNTISY